MSPTRSLVESALLSGLAVVLFLAAQFLPVVGVGFSLLAPAPLVILGLRHDLKKAALGLAISTLLAAVFLGPLSALFFLLGFGVLGVGLGFLAKRCGTSVEVLLYGILLSLGSKLLLMVIAGKVTGINPFQLDGAEMTAMIDRIFSFYETSGMSKEYLETVREQFTQSIAVLPLIFPTILTVAAALDCYLSYAVSAWVLRRIGGPYLPPLPPFSRWRFPKSVFGALLAAVILTLLGSRGTEWNLALRAGTNLRLLVNFLFLLQGLSLLWYYLGGAASRKGGRILRTVVIMVAVLVPLFSTLLVLAGIGDMWLDFRSRYRRNES